MDRNNINISLSLTLHFFREKNTYYYVHKLFGRMDRNNINVFCFNIDIKYFGMICRYNSGMRAFSGSGPRYVDDTLRVQFSVTSERNFFLYIIQPTSST